MENNRSFQGVWFPKAIWLSKELNMTEKCLMVEVESLSNTAQGCFASNQHFANFLGITKESVANIFSKLSKKGFITVTLIYKPGTKQIEKRFIKINDKFKLLQAGINTETDVNDVAPPPIHLKMNTSSLENEYPLHQKMNTSSSENEYPIHLKMKDNNTTTTNTITNTKETTTTKEIPNNNPSFSNNTISKTSSSNSKFSFLKKEKYSVLHPATRANVEKLFPDLTEDKFDGFFVMAQKEYKNGYAKSLDAVLVTSLKSGWNFKSEDVKINTKPKKDYSSIILNRFNYSLEYANLGYSEQDVISLFKKETIKFKEEVALLELYENKIIEFFQKKMVH